jgi:hypothetical protein
MLQMQDSLQAQEQAGRRLRGLTVTGEGRTALDAIRPGWLFSRPKSDSRVQCWRRDGQSARTPSRALDLERPLLLLLLLLRGRDGASLQAAAQDGAAARARCDARSRVSGAGAGVAVPKRRAGGMDLGTLAACSRQAVRAKQSKVDAGLVGSVSRGVWARLRTMPGPNHESREKPARFALQSTDSDDGRC